MKKLQISLYFLVVAFVAMLLPSCQSTSKSSSESKILKFNYEKDKDYEFEMVNDFSMDMPGQGSVSYNMLYSYSIHISDIENNTRLLSITYNRIKTDTKIGDVETSFDTENPASSGKNGENDMAVIFSGLVGKKYNMKVDEKGEILEVSGVDKIMNDLLESGNLSETMKKQLTRVKDKFSDQTARGQFAQVFTIFPNKQVKVGDTWNRTFMGADMMGASRSSNDYTVKQIDGDFVTLETKTTFSPALTPEIDPVPNGPNVNGTQSGQMVVDSRTGLVINAEYNLTMTSEAGGQKVEGTGKGRIKGTAK